MISSLDLSAGESKTRQFPAIDMARLLCAILVMTVHANPFTDVHPYLAYGLENYLARLAVPFFFVCAGYFCFRKTSLSDFDAAIPLAYGRRMLWLYLLWNGLYLIPILKTGSLTQVLTVFLFSGHFHLWYLSACAVAMVLAAAFLRKWQKPELLMILSGLLYMLGTLGDSWYGLLRPLEALPVAGSLLRGYTALFATTRNGLFEGLAFVAMGALFAYRRIVLSWKAACLGFGLSMLAMLAEAFAVSYWELARGHNLYFFLLPAVFYLFYILSHMEAPSCPSAGLRRCSTLAYFTHYWLVCLLQWTRVTVCPVHSVLGFGMVFAGTMLLCILIQQLQKRPCLRWLGKLFS